MDAAQRKKLVKRSVKRQFKQSPLLNLYTLLLTGAICIFEMMDWTTIGNILKPLNALLMSAYIITKLPSTKSIYIFIKSLYVLNFLTQLVLVFHQQQSPSKMFFLILVALQQVISTVLLNQKFCIINTSVLKQITMYCSAIVVLCIQGLIVYETNPFIRISQSEWFYLFCIPLVLPVLISILRYRYTTCRSFWFCFVSNLLIWMSYNGYCYQQITGEESIMVKTMISTLSQLGHFVFMHGIILHFMFRKSLLE